MSNSYSVYVHIRLDNYTVFYIGKGTGKRLRSWKRNRIHDNIANKHGMAIVIVDDNLTEKQAYEKEIELIEDYVFNLGYPCLIKGFKPPKGCKEYLTNQTWGGEGSSGSYKGEETRRKISKASINQWERMTKEEKVNYGRTMSRVWYNKDPKEREDIIRRRSETVINNKNNSCRKPVVVYNSNIEISFDKLRDAVNYFKISQPNASKCLKHETSHCGTYKGLPLIFEYKEIYENMTEQEKSHRITKALINTRHANTEVSPTK